MTLFQAAASKQETPSPSATRTSGHLSNSRELPPPSASGSQLLDKIESRQEPRRTVVQQQQQQPTIVTPISVEISPLPDADDGDTIESNTLQPYSSDRDRQRTLRRLSADSSKPEARRPTVGCDDRSRHQQTELLPFCLLPVVSAPSRLLPSLCQPFSSLPNLRCTPDNAGDGARTCVTKPQRPCQNFGVLRTVTTRPEPSSSSSTAAVGDDGHRRDRDCSQTLPDDSRQTTADRSDCLAAAEPDERREGEAEAEAEVTSRCGNSAEALAPVSPPRCSGNTAGRNAGDAAADPTARHLPRSCSVSDVRGGSRDGETRRRRRTSADCGATPTMLKDRTLRLANPNAERTATSNGDEIQRWQKNDDT